MSEEAQNIRWGLRPDASAVERDQYLAENAEDPEIRREAKQRLKIYEAMKQRCREDQRKRGSA